MILPYSNRPSSQSGQNYVIGGTAILYHLDKAYLHSHAYKIVDLKDQKILELFESTAK